MKTLDSKMKTIIDIAPALMMYVGKGWENRFDTQLDKIDFKKFSNCKFGEGLTTFRYDGFAYRILDDKLFYRSLSGVEEYSITKKQLEDVTYIS